MSKPLSLSRIPFCDVQFETAEEFAAFCYKLLIIAMESTDLAILPSGVRYADSRCRAVQAPRRNGVAGDLYRSAAESMRRSQGASESPRQSTLQYALSNVRCSGLKSWRRNDSAWSCDFRSIHEELV